MKSKLPISVAVLITTSVFASIADPVSDFKTGLTIPSGDKILKWESDINGDGKNGDVFVAKVRV
jgi:hypothetical protein